MSRSRERLDKLRQSVVQMTPAEAFAAQQRGALIIDVRESHERSDATAAGAQGISRGFLELRIEAIQPDADCEIILMCAGGSRSLFAADDLFKLGYARPCSVVGGSASTVRAGKASFKPLFLRIRAAQRHAAAPPDTP